MRCSRPKHPRRENNKHPGEILGIGSLSAGILEGRQIKMHPLDRGTSASACLRQREKGEGKVSSNYRGIQPIVTSFSSKDRIQLSEADPNARKELKRNKKRRERKREREREGESG